MKTKLAMLPVALELLERFLDLPDGIHIVSVGMVPGTGNAGLVVGGENLPDVVDGAQLPVADCLMTERIGVCGTVHRGQTVITVGGKVVAASGPLRIAVDGGAVFNPDTAKAHAPYMIKVFQPDGVEADRVTALDTGAHTVTRHRADAGGRLVIDGDSVASETLNVAAAGWTFTFPDDGVRRPI